MKRWHPEIMALLAAAACADPVSDSAAEQAAGLEQAAPALATGAMPGHNHGRFHIAMLDDCDPSDLGWNATGGCVLRGGMTTEAEFIQLLGSPLSTATVGHPAWRNEPSYLLVRSGKSVRVSNDGGRLHTFTEVAQFGGGRIPPLNIGLTPAPECALAPGAADPNAVFPGGQLELTGLSTGIHRYMCCIHPWMRALVRVES